MIFDAKRLTKAIQAQQLENMDNQLHSVRYKGSFADPYDAMLNTSEFADVRRSVEDLFYNLPHVVSVDLMFSSDGVSDTTKVILTTDKYTGVPIKTFLKSCCGVGRKDFAGYREGTDKIIVPFSGILSVEETANAFGIPLSKLEAVDDGEDEEIEIDLPDNPLAIDFPNPEDK